MSVYELTDRVHGITHKHYEIAKNGLGVISFCESRLGGRVHAAYRPDFTGARWWGIPYYTCPDGETLLAKMIGADNAYHAMALLRGAYGEMNETNGASPAQVAA